MQRLESNQWVLAHAQNSVYMSKNLQCNWERKNWLDIFDHCWVMLPIYQKYPSSKQHPESVHMVLVYKFWLQRSLCSRVCKGNIQRAMKATKWGQKTGAYMYPWMSEKKTCSSLVGCWPSSETDDSSFSSATMESLHSKIASAPHWSKSPFWLGL